jgi:transcriptional regulator GlxA family with amidase domain
MATAAAVAYAVDRNSEQAPEARADHEKALNLGTKVADGRVLTSAGISAGVDMALRVVERYLGADIARATARHMEYAYPETDVRRVQLPD